ncbi:hypothetical protein [Actinomadura xylanilytica]|uniref:hypothetical protein n=1 Tax=Actinomadura xylanilytica TaxID=887459 RepID=UPI00255AA02A|nr:hypothetical protein [Actinomadura xylanilytica]MDL4770691.1 hypothetical protein [Actinomadura xylanilytica]
MVKERLGHLKLATTGKYLHSLPTADETALSALGKIRSAPMAKEQGDDSADRVAANAEISRLRAIIADLTIAQHVDQGRNLRPA